MRFRNTLIGVSIAAIVAAVSGLNLVYGYKIPWECYLRLGQGC